MGIVSIASCAVCVDQAWHSVVADELCLNGVGGPLHYDDRLGNVRAAMVQHSDDRQRRPA